MNFKDGGTSISGCASQALSSSSATCATASLTLGSHAITADYSGDGNYPTATGALSGGQTVNDSGGDPPEPPVTLTVTTTGSGTVTSVPSGIACGSDCSESYPVGAAVTLTATAASGSGFTGWSGGCAGTAPTCALTLSADQIVTAMFSSLAPPRVTLGVLRNGQWHLDANGNNQRDDCGVDSCHAFGQAGDRSRLGVLRAGTAQWFLDRNGNGQWDNCVIDHCYLFGQMGDLPVAGAWIGGGFAQIGVFRNGQWYLDANGNSQWDGCAIDRCQSFGQFGDLPIVGDWSGDGKAKIGVFQAGSWYLDYNGNGQWDGCGMDLCYLKNSDQPSAGFGLVGDYPVVGDWSGDGVAKIGVYRNGSGFFDNGNGQWDGCGIDACVLRIPEQPNTRFGLPGDLPAVGRW